MSSVDTTVERAPQATRATTPHPDVVLDCHIKDLHYGTFRAVRDTAIPIKRNSISTLVRVPAITARRSFAQRSTDAMQILDFRKQNGARMGAVQSCRYGAFAATPPENS